MLARLAVVLLLVGACNGVSAQPRPPQDRESLRRAVESFVRAGAQSLPGEVAITVGDIEPGAAIVQCTDLQAFLPAGARLWGEASVGVRCSRPLPWTLYVPVRVRVSGPVVVAARSLIPGQVIAEADLALQQADLTALPASVATSVAHAVGRTPSLAVAPGQPLRGDLLRLPNVVTPGQTVKLIAQGPGFQVSSEGRSLGAAAAGQTVQVRSSAGRVVSGTARSGSVVEVIY